MARDGKNDGGHAGPEGAEANFPSAATALPSHAESPKSRPSESISDGQTKSGRQAGDRETRHREARELRQADDAREQEGDIRDAGACDTGGKRRPQHAGGFVGRPSRVPHD